MLIAPEALAALPGLAGAVVRDAEPLGLAQGAPERVTLDVAGARRDALLRRSPDLERAANNIAALEALGRARFAAAPRSARLGRPLSSPGTKASSPRYGTHRRAA